MNFPQHYYFTRGAPVCRREMFTTYGYLIQNVPIGKGMLSQQPRPKDMSTTRHRHDACVIRPERSLSVKQIQSGEYFTRPDVGKFEALMRKELMAAAKPLKPPPMPMAASTRSLEPSTSMPTMPNSPSEKASTARPASAAVGSTLGASLLNTAA